MEDHSDEWLTVDTPEVEQRRALNALRTHYWDFYNKNYYVASPLVNLAQKPHDEDMKVTVQADLRAWRNAQNDPEQSLNRLYYTEIPSEQVATYATDLLEREGWRTETNQYPTQNLWWVSAKYTSPNTAAIRRKHVLKWGTAQNDERKRRQQGKTTWLQDWVIDGALSPTQEWRKVVTTIGCVLGVVITIGFSLYISQFFWIPPLPQQQKPYVSYMMPATREGPSLLPEGSVSSSPRHLMIQVDECVETVFAEIEALELKWSTRELPARLRMAGA